MTSFTASTRRTTGTGCRRPRGTAPQAWCRFPPSLPPPSLQPPRLTLPVSQPRPSPKRPPPLPGLRIHARASVLLPWPPPQTAPSARLPASAGEPGPAGEAGALQNGCCAVRPNHLTLQDRPRRSGAWGLAAHQPGTGSGEGRAPVSARSAEPRATVGLCADRRQRQGGPWVF